jgi:DNA (cytosine-5)-methyltransferase 1
VFESRFARNGRGAPSDVVPPLKASSGETGKGDAAPLVASLSMVRRLTPVECSRLQGFPDDYLPSVTFRGKCPPSDGPMYKALGNSMAVPVMSWIGRKIKSVVQGRKA